MANQGTIVAPLLRVHGSETPILFQMNLTRHSIFCYLLFFVAFVLDAQDPQDTQAKTKELEKQTIDLKENPADEEEDEEFGKLLTLKRTKPWFIIPYASARGYWTSNVLLANKGEKGDAVFNESQGFSAGYRLNNDWRIQTGYSYQLTRYQENPALDIDSHNLEAGTTYKLPWNLQLGTGIRGLWLTSPQQEVEVYRENNPYVSLSQTYSFLENRLNLFYGYQFDRKFTNPIGFDRNEHAIFSGISYSWLPNLLTQVVLRQSWQFYDFRPSTNPVNGRQEWISSVVFQNVWQPLSWLQVSAFGITSYDNSINSTRDSKVANLGGDIRVFWKF